MLFIAGDADTGCSVGEKKKVNRIIGLKRHRDGELLALVCDKNGTYKLERTRVLQKTCPQVCRFCSFTLISLMICLISKLFFLHIYSNIAR